MRLAMRDVWPRQFRLPTFNRYSLHSGAVLRQLDVSRTKYHRSPLYRYWSHEAYQRRLIYFADKLPDQLGEYLPSALVILPPAFLFVYAVFGTALFSILALAFGVFVLVSGVVVSGAGVFLSAFLPAQGLEKERLTGRWELLLLLPKERTAMLWMRVTTTLYPYRQLLTTLEVLQGLLAILVLLGVFVREQNVMDSMLLSSCLIFLTPGVFLLIWERRQDFVLSVMIGTYAGLFPTSRRASTVAVMGIGMLLFGRLAAAMIAFIVAGSSGNPEIIVPALVGGPALLPMLNIPLEVSFVILFLYYGGRELILERMLSRVIARVEEGMPE